MNELNKEKQLRQIDGLDEQNVRYSRCPYDISVIQDCIRQAADVADMRGARFKELYGEYLAGRKSRSDVEFVLYSRRMWIESLISWMGELEGR